MQARSNAAGAAQTQSQGRIQCGHCSLRTKLNTLPGGQRQRVRRPHDFFTGDRMRTQEQVFAPVAIGGDIKSLTGIIVIAFIQDKQRFEQMVVCQTQFIITADFPIAINSGIVFTFAFYTIGCHAQIGDIAKHLVFIIVTAVQQIQPHAAVKIDLVSQIRGGGVGVLVARALFADGVVGTKIAQHTGFKTALIAVTWLYFPA